MKITTAHGGGGRETSRLIHEVFASAFGSQAEEDAATLDFGAKKIALTTDAFVVRPLFFKGGDIGRLAVCGTVNDLLTAGATPRYLTAAFIIEEGADTQDLAKIARSMRLAADEAGVSIVTGDTKVIGGAGGVYITTAGAGEIDGAPLTFKNARIGDKIIVTGTLGDHQACIMSVRMGLENDIESDAAPLTAIANALRGKGLRGMRDITRGGLATCLNEAADMCGLRAEIQKPPVAERTAALCEILGLEPIYMANEGKMLAAVAPEHADAALKAVRASAYGADAEIIGEFTQGAGVVMRTEIGGRRIIPPLAGETLPRVC